MHKGKINTKTKEEINIMAEGGKKLAEIKSKLKGSIKEGVNAEEVEKLANQLIQKLQGKASFKMVPRYNWATCININDGIVHGIPKGSMVFQRGDLVSVDVGFYYKGFHTDTSFSVNLGSDKEINGFLKTGEQALDNAIDAAKVGNRIYDISKSIEETLKSKKLSPIRALVGHGIGRDLHESPQIPCFVSGKREETEEIPDGAVFAIEVMYTKGGPDVKLARDGWTISTRSGKIAGLFEETVAVTSGGPLVLTKSN